MKVVIAGCAWLLAALSAQPETAGRHEAVLKEMLVQLDKLTSGLAAIKDEESAKAAQAGLKQAAKDWEAIKKKADNLPPPTPQERDQLVKKFKIPLEAAQKKLFTEVGRVRIVPGGLEALKAISAVLTPKAKEKEKKE